MTEEIDVSGKPEILKVVELISVGREEISKQLDLEWDIDKCQSEDQMTSDFSTTTINFSGRD